MDSFPDHSQLLKSPAWPYVSTTSPDFTRAVGIGLLPCRRIRHMSLKAVLMDWDFANLFDMVVREKPLRFRTTV